MHSSSYTPDLAWEGNRRLACVATASRSAATRFVRVTSYAKFCEFRLVLVSVERYTHRNRT